MPSTNALTINDGTVNVVFTPDFVTGTHVQLQNLGQAVLGQRELIHFDRPASGKEIRRAFRVNTPVEVTLADGTKVVRMVTVRVEEISPADVPVAARTRARVLAANGLTHADTVKVFDNPEWFW